MQLPDERPWAPRARDLPHWRDDLREAWAPDGPYTRLTPVIAAASGGSHTFIPPWEYDTIADAALWFVGAAMCDLVAASAVQLPATVLDHQLVPDPAGLVVFESALTGIDSDALQLGPCHVGAMLWGPALWAQDGSPIIGITVYGPAVAARRPWMYPLGGLIWPFGRSCDDPLNDDEFHDTDRGEESFWGAVPQGPLDDTRVASMAEDRRRLAALWLLASQPGLATSVRRHPDRPAQRQQARTGRDTTVRFVDLRRRPAGDEGSASRPGRTYRHRWTVAGHWRQQAHGPGYSQHRPVYINAHLKGPDDAPLLTTPKVKVVR